MPSRLGRKPYWIIVAVLLAVKIGLVLVLDVWPQYLSVLKAVDNVWIIALAFTIGYRFADSGLSKWLGIGLTFLITPVLSLALLFGVAGLPSTAPTNPMDIIPDWVGWITSALLFALIIFAGVRRSASS